MRSERKVKMRCSVVVVVMLVACFGAASVAAPIDVGTIMLESYAAATGDGLGGVDIQMRYVLDPSFADQDCCEEGDLRWLQRVTSSSDTGFTPTPNRPFIDPRTGQDLGGAGVGDGLPFYDITYNSVTDRDNGANEVHNGSGQFYNDSPRVLLTRGPYSFMAETLLVCIEPDMMLGILGGIKWGFDIAADMMTVTPHATMALGDTMAIRDAFNTALGLDFPGWTIKPSTTLWPDEQPRVTLTVPETGSAILALVAITVYSFQSRGRSFQVASN